MASTYSLSNDKGNNGNGNGLSILASAIFKLIPVIMAAWALYESSIAQAQKDEATRVEVQQLKDDVKALKEAHYLTRDDIKDFLDPLKQGVADQKDALRDINNWLREHGGRRPSGD